MGVRKTVNIKPDEIQLFARYIYGISGINIEASKAYLIETRLGRILESENCSSYSEFYHKIKVSLVVMASTTFFSNTLVPSALILW